MFSTRRSTEHIAFRRVLPRAAVALLLLGVAASCSEDRADAGPNLPDAGPPEPDAGPPGYDASVDARTDAPDDVARPEVTCAVTPCARALSASWSESFCALLDDGRVACWGRNANGELGRDAGSWSATAAPVEGVTKAVALDRTCAVDADGKVVCWGPTQAPVWDEASRPAVRSVRSGNSFGCAVLTDGQVACWGKNGEDGVLAYAGAGIGADVPPTIVPIDGPVDEIAIARGTALGPPPFPWLPPAPVTVHAVIARRANGEVLSWGRTPLIGRATELKPDPIPGRIAVDHATHVSGGHGGCVLAGTELGCWGYGRDPADGAILPLPITGVPRAVDVALGDYGDGHFGRGCAVTPGGKVYCWGENDYGQAGDGTQVFRDLAVEVKDLPEPIVRVQATARTSCALAVSGRIYCWGDDAFGQRGQKKPFTKNPSPLPVELP